MLVVFGACAHKPVAGVSPPENRLSVESFKKAKLSEPVLLRLKANLGQIEKTRFNSASKTEVFEKGSLTNTLEESIEFLANAEITKILKTDDLVEMLKT